MSDVYALHGVRIRAPFALGRTAVEGEPDLVMEMGSPSDPAADDLVGEQVSRFVLGEMLVYQAARQEGRTVLRIHGLCDFVIDADLKYAVCHPVPEAPAGAVALVTRGAFLALWLGLHGHPTFHGSAVEVDGAGIAFVGASGMGKSTLAGWACARGARFVCDDLLRLGEQHPPHWLGHSPELRLRDGAQTLLQGKMEAWDVHRSPDDRWAATPPAAEATHGPISAVVVPRPNRETEDVLLTPVDPAEAVLVLARFPRLEGWLAPDVVESQFDGAARLAGEVPVFVADVPWGPPFSDAAMDELLDRVLHERCEP
ncbi:MAG: hypothetical protein ACYDD4_00525 [Acidimicrobiales bacterium]